MARIRSSTTAVLVLAWALFASSAQAATFERPPTDEPVPDGVKAACTPEKSSKISEIQKRGTLEWAVGIAAPFGFRDKSGSLVGIEIDNAAELAHFLGVKPDVADYDYNLLPTAVATKQADIIGAELFKTEERRKAIDYSDTYFVAGNVFLVTESSSYKTVQDLDTDKNVFVHEIGGGQVEMAKSMIPKAQIRLVPKRGQLLVAYDFMKAGEGDSTAYEAHYYPVVRVQYPGIVAIGKNGRIVGNQVPPEEMLYPFEIGFGLPKGDKDWATCVNSYVDHLKSSGVLTKRINYWANVIGSVGLP